GQSYIGWRPDPVEDAAFFYTLWRQGGSSLYDTHPTRRAAPPAATHRGVRDLGRSARLQHAEAHRGDDVRPVGVSDPDRLETRLEASTHGARHQDDAERSAKGHRDDGAYAVQTLTFRRVRGIAVLQDLLQPACFTDMCRHFSPGLDKAEQGQGG